MNNLKKAHNFRHICMLKNNVGKVAQALLSKSQGSQGSQGTLEATQKQDKCESWISKHRRLLRKRSTDSDVGIVATEAQDSKETLRISILALYGVHSNSNNSVAKDVMGLSDEEPSSLCSTPVLGHHGSATSCSRPNQYYDELFWRSGARLVGRECGSI